MEAGNEKRYRWQRVQMKRNKGDSPVVSKGFKGISLPNLALNLSNSLGLKVLAPLHQ